MKHGPKTLLMTAFTALSFLSATSAFAAQNNYHSTYDFEYGVVTHQKFNTTDTPSCYISTVPNTKKTTGLTMSKILRKHDGFIWASELDEREVSATSSNGVTLTGDGSGKYDVYLKAREDGRKYVGKVSVYCNW